MPGVGVKEGRAPGAEAGDCREALGKHKLCKRGGGVLAGQRGTQVKQSNAELEEQSE